MRSSSDMVDDMYIASLARRAVDLPRKAGNRAGIADAMLDSPDMAGGIYTASFQRRTVDMPYVASNMTGIAVAMCNSPEMAGDIYAASCTRCALLTCLIWQVHDRHRKRDAQHTWHGR